MPIKEIKKCLMLRKELGKKIIFEVSGGINLENVIHYSKLDIDYISTSKITNSVKSVDIGLDII
jgi:nicotinate-nucleotide pyrophosphorylase (carboxylating)